MKPRRRTPGADSSRPGGPTTARLDPPPAEAGRYSPVPPRRKGSGTGGAAVMLNDAGALRRTDTQEDVEQERTSSEGGSSGDQRGK